MTANRLGEKSRHLLGDMWEEAFHRNGNIEFKIISGSMVPLINIGDVVRVAKAQPESIRIGDIGAFRDGEYVIVHRIIGKAGNGRALVFRHRGDGASRSVGRFPAECLIGRVVAIKREGKIIRLGTPFTCLRGAGLGWWLRLADSINRIRNRNVRAGMRQVFRPVWRLGRGILFWHA